MDNTHRTKTINTVAFSPFGNNLSKITISDMIASNSEISRDVVNNATVVIFDKLDGRLVSNARSPNINGREDSNVNVEERGVETAVHIVVKLFHSEGDVVRKRAVGEDNESIFVSKTFRFAEVDNIFRENVLTVDSKRLGLIGNEEVDTTVTDNHFINNEKTEFKVVQDKVVIGTVLVTDLVRRTIHVGNSLEFDRENGVSRNNLGNLIAFEREELEGGFFRAASGFSADKHNFTST